ncbi:hypothetical protein GCM10009863_52700 [Streptomyces axinellae]|uniref:Uncharacterized protein n=2 Tax=Streptomyces axinellae TaxID=552788 RepID=A0ABP6CXG8_9ACTN
MAKLPAMNTTWHLLVERHETAPGGGFWGSQVLGQYVGTRERAMALLEERARNYVPEHPWNRERTQLYRITDGFMKVTEGVRHRRRWTCRFVLAELLHDDGAGGFPFVAPPPPSTPPDVR